MKLYDIKYTRKIDEEVMKMDSVIKSIIDRMWLDFFSGGVTNPLTVIEQITYLLFIKGLDDIEIAHERNDVMLGITSKRIFDKEHQNCRWSKFKDYPAEKMFKTKNLLMQNIWKMQYL